MNRNFPLAQGSPALGSPGQVPWINPVTKSLEWVMCPITEDFLMPSITSGGLGWSTTLLNSATVTIGSFGSDAGHSGMVTLSTATLSNGAACLRTVSNSLQGGSIKQKLLFCFKSYTALSNGTDRYELAFGFGDGSAVAHTNGVYLSYLDTANSGNLVGKTRAAGVETVASGGTAVPYVADTWYWGYIEYDGVTAKFWVAPDLSGKPGIPGDFTFLGQSTTNLPLTTNRYGVFFNVIKTVGTTARFSVIDKVIFATQ